MNTSLRRPFVAASLIALVASGCGARTVLRDSDDGGVGAPDVTPGADAPPADVPITPLDVLQPPPVDVPVPPVDVPLSPVDGPPETTSCERATPVFDGTVLATQDTVGLVGTAPTCPSPGLPGGGPRWYRATLEPRQTLTVSAINDGGVRPPLVRLYNACTDRMCTAGSNTAVDGRTVTLRFTNPAATPQSVFIAVSGITPGIPSRFILQTSITRAPTNVACADATPVMDGASLSSQEPSAAIETQAPCPGEPGVPTLPVLFYSAVVPPGRSLFATATPEGAVRAEPRVRIIPDCGVTTCLASSTSSGGGAFATWFNAGRSDQRVVVTLGALPAGASDRFTMTFRIRPPATNSVCASATRVANGTMLRAESLADGREPAAWCNAGRNPNALFYAVRVGAGEVLTARANNSTGAAFPVPTLRLGVGCATTNCLASSVSGTTPGSQLTWLNTTGLPQEVLLAADAGSAGAPALRFDLAITVGVPPYAVSRTSIACDPMGMAAVIPGAVGDDVGTAANPMPIRFPYFGAPMMSWSVSTNGYLQVWPTLTGRSAGALGVTALPDARAPGNMIAPFWDDLEVRTAGGMDVRWQVFEAPERHLTAQWTNVGVCCGGGSPDRMTFQVKLFERTGVVEFHYCDQSGSERSRGSSASVGLQDETGSRGVSAQLRMATIDPMTAYRFTPTP